MRHWVAYTPENFGWKRPSNSMTASDVLRHQVLPLTVFKIKFFTWGPRLHIPIQNCCISAVQHKCRPGQVYRGRHLQQRGGTCPCFRWVWCQVWSQSWSSSSSWWTWSLCWWWGPGYLLWRQPCGRRSSLTWSLVEVTLWGCPAGEQSYMHPLIWLTRVMWIKDWDQWLSGSDLPLPSPSLPLPCLRSRPQVPENQLFFQQQKMWRPPHFLHQIIPYQQQPRWTF